MERAALASVDLSDALGASLQEYYALLRRWSSAINLTGFDLTRPEPRSIDRLLIEPIKAAALMPPGIGSLLDLGSGGGSPAIPVKLARPDISLVMVECTAKKAVFLRLAVRQLGLVAASVVEARYERLLGHIGFHETFDAVMARAIRVGPAQLSSIGNFLQQEGSLYLFTTTGGAAPPLNTSRGPRASVPLLSALGSQLTCISKRSIGHMTEIIQ